MISVIMPLYNNEKYVEESIQSVINQTYTDWELLIINDASTDNSLQIAEKLAKTDNRIKLINLKENKGVSHARNLGIKESKGEYISFLDSDDLWDKAFLKNTSTLLFNQKKDLVYSNFAFLYNNKLIQPINATLINGSLNDFIIKTKQRYETIFPFCVGTFLIKKSLIIKYNITFPEDQHLFEDTLVWTELLCITKAVSLNQVLLYYRQHSESITHKTYTTNDYLQELTYLNKLKNFVIKSNKNIILLDKYITYRTYRVINSILKSGDISNALYNIKRY